MKYFKDVKCVRINENELQISWKDNNIENIKLFLIDGDKEQFLVRVNNKNCIVIKDPNINKRNTFILKAENYHSEYVAEVLIPFEGIHHFRDIGGYKSADGRRVKWNTFFRADKLSNLTSKDIKYFDSLGIKTILDLRSKGEVLIHPDMEFKGTRYINISGMAELDDTQDNFDMISIVGKKQDTEYNSKDFLIKGYKNMVFNNLALKELVDCMENEEGLPIVFHCTAGKDRTGFAAALILLILGVSEEVIIEDYLLSNIFRKDINKKIIDTIVGKISNSQGLTSLKYMLEVQQEYIEAAFNSIKEKYGTIDIYLEKEYGLTKKKRKELKCRFLY